MRKMFFDVSVLIVLKDQKGDIFKCKNIFFINIGRYFKKIWLFF